MKLHHWRHLLDHAGPFATVSLDVSHPDEAGGREVRLRWEAIERVLTGHGAPATVLDILGPLVVEGTNRHGGTGRLLIAAGTGEDVEVLLDSVLPEPPAAQESLWSRVPQLMPAVRAMNGSASYLLVKIDRAGADIELHGALGQRVEFSQVDGDNDVLHKVRRGGTAHLRYQHRAEDSWERNATEVVQTVAGLERRHRPSAILLAGDERAVTAFTDHAPAEITEITGYLSTGGRAEGISATALATAVTDELTRNRRRVQRVLTDRFAQAEGRQDTAVSGLEDVVDALRRGQVDEVLLHDDPTSTLHLWIGDEPLQIATTASDVRSMGAADPQKVRADAALAWACLASDAGITLLDDEDVPRLNDGIGAVLRWSDRSTPHESIPSMPGHGEARGGEPVV